MGFVADILKGCFFVVLMMLSLVYAQSSHAQEALEGGERAHGGDFAILAKELKKVELGYLLNGYTDGELKVHDFKQPAQAPHQAGEKPRQQANRMNQACVQMRQAYKQAQADAKNGTPAYISYDDVQAACYQ